MSSCSRCSLSRSASGWATHPSESPGRVRCNRGVPSERRQPVPSPDRGRSIASSSGASGPATGPRPRTPDGHDIEYNAIREAAAVIDVSPLYKYRVTEAATRLPSSTGSSPATPRSSTSARSSTRPGATSTARSSTMAPVHRLSEDEFFWTAADPQLRWLTLNARGLDVQIEDVTEAIAAVALQGRSPERSSRTRRRSHSTSCATSAAAVEPRPGIVRGRRGAGEPPDRGLAHRLHR